MAAVAMTNRHAMPAAKPSPTIRAPVLLAAVCLLAGAVFCEAQTAPPAGAAAVTAATKEKPWVNSLGMKFVPAPGTEVLFSIWETRVKDYAAYAAAQSGVDGSWRNLGFTQQETHPVANVSWEDARGFCRWLTEKERAAGLLSTNQSYRLPTDAEWSWAVGIGEREGSGSPKDKDEKVQGVYPWGTQWPPPSGAGNYDPSLNTDNYDRTAPVGSFAANRLGFYDLGGNVWEWCEDAYGGGNQSRVLRGASWNIDLSGSLKSSRRGIAVPGYRLYHIGFRVVVVVPPLGK
jgi:formylglycine-generating enzyme required for sulfatase activity